ncbi:MAG: caspase family protein [Armatimonadetes bacterium]|nr:caspase family protein [Armatimonadota bacterium]
MRLNRIALLVAVCACAPLAFSQAWKDAYDKGLAAAKAGDWETARASFKAAVAARPEDQSAATILPGPVTEPNRWRGGAPYSPNFGAAYATVKAAVALKEADRAPLLQEAQSGFETLVEKGQVSPATVYWLGQVYTLLKLSDKQNALDAKVQGNAMSWSVDAEIMTPEDAGMVGSLSPMNPDKRGGTQISKGSGPKVTVFSKPTDKTGTVSIPTTSLTGKVPVLSTKFALLIGNTQTQMSSGSVPFAASDALAVRDGLTNNAGYDEKNVDMVSEGTASQMLAAAKALADRIPNDATVMIYFSGIGVNVDGKDYFAGIDAAMSTDTNKMVSQDDLLQPFRSKGARVFLFCQANRPIESGRFFGMDSGLTGMLARTQATSPGGNVLSTTIDGKSIGLYTKAFVDTLAEFRSNKIPVTEFSWSVFQAMQGGFGAAGGTGTGQVPSIPAVQYMPLNASF